MREQWPVIRRLGPPSPAVVNKMPPTMAHGQTAVKRQPSTSNWQDKKTSGFTVLTSGFKYKLVSALFFLVSFPLLAPTTEEG